MDIWRSVFALAHVRRTSRAHRATLLALRISSERIGEISLSKLPEVGGPRKLPVWATTSQDGTICELLRRILEIVREEAVGEN